MIASHHASDASELLESLSSTVPGNLRHIKILFNPPVSGPPSQFFICHAHPIVHLFGNISWVEGAAFYEGLTELWVREIQETDINGAHVDVAKALKAILISLSAEQSMRENRRIVLM